MSLVSYDFMCFPICYIPIVYVLRVIIVDLHNIIHWFQLSLLITCTPYTVRRTVYTVRRTLYAVQCTPYIVHCTAYTVRRTVYASCLSLKFNGDVTLYWG